MTVHDHDYDHDNLHDTTTKGWRFGGSSPWMSHHPTGSRQGHPRYTGAVTTEGRGWPERRPKGRSDTPGRITQTRQQRGLPTNMVAER